MDPVHLQYLTETAARRDISDIKEFTGRFVYSYYKSYVLSTLTVTGFAQKVTVTVASGQEVAEGDVLAQFDTGSLEESIARAQVTVEELRQQVTDEEDALLAFADRVYRMNDGRVSGELHRVREGETVDRIHEEYAVIDKNGFVQIPKAVLEKAKMGDQVIFSSENEGEILIKKKHSGRTAEK